MQSLALLPLLYLAATAIEPRDDCRRTYLLDTQACTASYTRDLALDTPLADGTRSACLEGAQRDYAQCVDRVWGGSAYDI